MAIFKATDAKGLIGMLSRDKSGQPREPRVVYREARLIEQTS